MSRAIKKSLRNESPSRVVARVGADMNNAPHSGTESGAGLLLGSGRTGIAAGLVGGGSAASKLADETQNRENVNPGVHPFHSHRHHPSCYLRVVNVVHKEACDGHT